MDTSRANVFNDFTQYQDAEKERQQDLLKGIMDRVKENKDNK